MAKPPFFLLQHSRTPQRGNIFFIILMGILLFAAVSTAIVRSGSSGVTAKTERSAQLAQQIMRYAGEVRDGVDRLYVNNKVSEANIRFSHPRLAAAYGDMSQFTYNQVFAEEGGGVPFMDVPYNAQTTNSNNWEFFSTSDIPQVGTTAPDLVIVAPNLKEAVCRKINETLGYAYTAAIPVDASSDSKCVMGATGERYNGTYATGGNINTVGTSNFTVLPAYEACVSCSGTYHYYKVLIER